MPDTLVNGTSVNTHPVIQNKLANHKQVHIISAPFSLGGRHWGCHLGPNAYLLNSLIHQIGHDQRSTYRFRQIVPTIKQLNVQSYSTEQSKRVKRSLTQSYLVELASEIAHLLQQHQQGRAPTIPIIIGGDHTIAMGSWRGVTYGCGVPGKIGMMWVDAHLDSHNWTTSESGNIHGMPLANLLGHAPLFSHHLLDTGPLLDPRYTALFGVRSYEPAELTLMNALNIPLYKDETINDHKVDQLAFTRYWIEALERVSQSPNGYGISIDLDAFNPLDFAAVSVPEQGGIFLCRFIATLKACKGRFKPPLAIEIVEFNPVVESEKRAKHRKQFILLVRALIETFY